MHPGAHAADHPDKPAIIMAAHRRDHHLRRARRRGQPARPAVPRGRARAGRPHRLLPREPPAVPAARVGRAATPGSYYTAMSSRLTTDEMRLHRQRLRRPGLHHVDVQGRRWPPSWSTRCPTSSSRLMIDGDDRRLRVLRGRRRRASPPSRSPDPRSPGSDMLYSLGHDGPPQGREARRSPATPSSTPTAVTGLGQLLLGYRRGHGLPVAGAAVPRRPAALHPWPCTRSAAPSS